MRIRIRRSVVVRPQTALLNQRRTWVRERLISRAIFATTPRCLSKSACSSSLLGIAPRS